MKEGVDRGVAYSTYYVTKQPLAHNIISNALAINILTDAVYFVCTLLHR